jgi:hypothetical protein
MLRTTKPCGRPRKYDTPKDKARHDVVAKRARRRLTRHPERTDESPYTIKGQTIIPKKSGKILGLVMDSELRYEEHMATAATRGLRAAMCLRRLKMLTPRTARQLFVATVAPTMDYASTV